MTAAQRRKKQCGELFEHFMHILGDEDDRFGSELCAHEIGAIFMEAFHAFAHETGHVCEREAREAPKKARARKPKVKDDFIDFLRHIGGADESSKKTDSGGAKL